MDNEQQVVDDLNEEMRKVIALLQQGEKYKKMWGLNMEETLKNSKEGETIHPTRILLDLEKLEQKYFLTLRFKYN